MKGPTARPPAQGTQWAGMPLASRRTLVVGVSRTKQWKCRTRNADLSQCNIPSERWKKVEVPEDEEIPAPPGTLSPPVLLLRTPECAYWFRSEKNRRRNGLFCLTATELRVTEGNSWSQLPHCQVSCHDSYFFPGDVQQCSAKFV